MIRVILVALLCASASLAQAAEDATASLVRILGGINSMQAAFTQRTVDAKGNNQPAQLGTMSARRPGQFRWEVKKPSPQLVLTSGKTLWIYDPELMQATRQRLNQQVGNTPALLLSGDTRKLAEAFIVSEEKGEGGEKVFLLKPRSPEALFEHLRVRFRDGALVQMELADTLGQQTDISFSDIRLNPALSASQFEFTPPKGVDVIDQL